MVTVLGMGNALVDKMIQIENDQLLRRLGLPKGSMQLVDANKSAAIREACKDRPTIQVAGGSASNTIFGLASLGASTAFIGKIGDDEIGHLFRSDIEAAGIKPLLSFGTQPSGLAAALVSPDSERTFGTYLGSAVELSADDLTPELFVGYTYFHIEGYLVQNHDLMRRAIALARQAGCLISIDLASYNVVADNLEFLKEIMAEKLHVVFANEEEAKAFTGLEPEDAINEIAKMADIAVVKIGNRGALVKSGHKQVHVPALRVRPVDTTGAGDLFASGFLYGIGTRQSIKEAAELGTKLAAAVIGVIGARPETSFWEQVKQ